MSKLIQKYNKANKGGCFIRGKECPERNSKKPTKSANIVEETKHALVLTASTHDSKE